MRSVIMFLLSLIIVVTIFLSSVNANPYSANLYTFTSSGSINISGNLTNFTELLDTPSSYAGSAGKCVLVNPTETGLNFTTCPSSGGGGAVDSVTSLSSYIIITPTTGDVEVDLDDTLLEETINLSIDNKVTQNFLENILDSVYYGLDNPYNYTNKTLLSEFANDVGFITWAIADNGTLFRTDQYNASGLIRDWNITGYIIDWNSTGYIIDWNSTGLIINWSDSFVDNNLNLLNGSNISISESGLNRTININTTGLEEWLNNLYQPLGNVTNTSYITLDQYYENATQTFILIDEEINLNVNSSIYWANLSAYNTTQFEKQNLNILGINNTWLTDFINSFGFLTTITNIFDQSLNTTDNVTFNNINISNYANVSGFINTESGYLYQGTDATGNFLKGDGIAFRPGLITASDVPAIQSLTSGFGPGNIIFQGQATLLNDSDNLNFDYLTEILKVTNLNVTNNATIINNLTSKNIFATNVCYSDGTNCTSTGGGGGFTTDQNEQLNTTGSPTFQNISLQNVTANKYVYQNNNSFGNCYNGTDMIFGYIDGDC